MTLADRIEKLAGEAEPGNPKLQLRYTDQHCGCLAEDWLLVTMAGNTLDLWIHFENGMADVATDTGDDWDDNASLPCRTLEEGRAAAFAWLMETAEKHGW